MKSPAFYAKGVTNLELDDISLEWENPSYDFFTNGLEIENFENFTLRNFKIHAAFDRQESIRYQNLKRQRTINYLMIYLLIKKLKLSILLQNIKKLNF